MSGIVLVLPPIQDPTPEKKEEKNHDATFPRTNTIPAPIHLEYALPSPFYTTPP
jgi:hypothetical protein